MITLTLLSTALFVLAGLIDLYQRPINPDWDSLKPIKVYSGTKGIGVLEPRATDQQLGFGIQGWSRPETDSRK